MLPGVAAAYPTMIRHNYASCAACHVDPSGGGLLTVYGRAQSELLLPTHFGPRAEDQEISPSTAFLFGAVELPEWLNLGLSFRGGALLNQVGETRAVRPVQMTTDVRAHAQFGPLRAGGSLGFAMRRALPAAVTPLPENNVVSREHWLGLDAADQTLLLRVGRLNLPFGLRNVEHSSWVRSETRTDFNDQQQHGVALSYSADALRMEVMGIAGNLQLAPAYYRERGYAGFLELAPQPNLAVGMSSLMTQARYDANTREAFLLRQVHGFFGRWAPVAPLVLMGEVNALVATPQGLPHRLGFVGLIQSDYEPLQGLHFIASGEALQREGFSGLGGWLSIAWIFNPHAEIRVDAILRRTSADAAPVDTLTVIGQLHLSI